MNKDDHLKKENLMVKQISQKLKKLASPVLEKRSKTQSDHGIHNLASVVAQRGFSLQRVSTSALDFGSFDASDQSLHPSHCGETSGARTALWR